MDLHIPGRCLVSNRDTKFGHHAKISEGPSPWEKRACSSLNSEIHLQDVAHCGSFGDPYNSREGRLIECRTFLLRDFDTA
jgi:hypothetical protein